MPPDGEALIIPLHEPLQVTLLVVIPNANAAGSAIVKLVLTAQLEASRTVTVCGPAQSELVAGVVKPPGDQV